MAKHAHFEGGNSTPRTVAEPPPSPVETPAPPPAAQPADLVTVLLLGDHVYLPRDASEPGWATSQDTVRVDGTKDGRRARVVCHPTLAAFLQERGQAEMLD